MSDIFIEQLVKKETKSSDKIKTILYFLTATILSFVSLIYLGFIFPLVLAGSFFGAIYLSSLNNVEYEYIFTNTELDIDAIYNKQRRKRKISTDLKQSTLITYFNNKQYENAHNDAKVLDFSSGANYQNVYYIITNIDNKKVKLLFEPNEEMISALEKKLSRNIFIKK